ncbi:MAG TPA: hypothetical protein VIF08_00915 [Candidatus Limnocylindrales bacterium]|jgi:hypothetical protein
MATQGDVRRIALGLPDVVAEGSTFRVDGHLVAWPWLERIDPKKARVANPEVLVVRVASELDKHALIDLDPAVFFTETHFDGYAMVLVRLAAIDDALLAKLLADSWTLAKAKRKRR